MNKILGWFKFIGGAIIAIGITILIFYKLMGKSKRKAQIDEKIRELEAIDAKTEANKQELERLRKEAEDIQKDIEDTNRRYAEKLKDLKHEPEKPGDAGKAADDLTKNW